MPPTPLYQNMMIYRWVNTLTDKNLASDEYLNIESKYYRKIVMHILCTFSCYDKNLASDEYLNIESKYYRKTVMHILRTFSCYDKNLASDEYLNIESKY